MRALPLAALPILFVALATSAQAQSRRAGQPDQRAPQTGDTKIIMKEDKKFPLGANWVAVSINDKPYTGAERPIFLLNDQYRATGFGGCNSFSATAFPLREQAIAVGPLALTRRSCDKGVMEAERAYFIALRTTQKWDTVQGALVLTGPNGQLKFERSL